MIVLRLLAFLAGGLVLILPPELTSGEKCWVCCQATVVRVEDEGTEFGVAAQIRRMDILPEIGI